MQTLVNRAERIVMPPRKDGTAYALAWEDGKKVEEMERVVWKTLEYTNEDGVKDTKGIWVHPDDFNRRWSTAKRKFVDRLTGNDL